MPVTIALFFDRLRASEALDPEQIDALWQRIPEDKRDLLADKIVPKLVEAKKLTAYQADTLLSGGSDPLLLGDYVILERIGSGGMGQVYKAEHRMMKRVVALKVLPTEQVKSPDAVKRFHREAQAAARLLHPNIVTAFDANKSGDVHFLVMEHVNGQDLSAISKARGALPIGEAVNYVLQAARGLAYAHGKGVVHRDIKPANLLVDEDGTVKILDMGLARIETAAGVANRGAQEQLTQSGQVMGTLDFMAPEQAFDTRSADGRSDIYSLGCSLYRLLTGETMFAGDSLVQIILAHREQPAPSICARRPEVPEALDAIFQKMVAKTPEGRQASMAEVVAALESLQRPTAAAEGAAAQAAGAMGDLLQISTRMRPAPREESGGSSSKAVGSSVRAAAADIPVVVVGGSTSKLAGAAQETKPQTPAARPTDSSLRPRDTITELKPQAAASSSKKSLLVAIAAVAVCVALLSVAGIVWAMRDSIFSKTKVSPPRHSKGATSDAFKPGQPAEKLSGLLAQPVEIFGVKQWQVDTAAPRLPALAIAWAPDSQRVVVAGEGRDLRVYDSATWELKNVLVGHKGTVRAVAWSPDGSVIASCCDDRSVRLWRPDGTPGPVISSFTKPSAVAWSPDGQWLVVTDADPKTSMVRLYFPDGKAGPALPDRSGGIWNVSWQAESSRQFLSCSQDKKLQLWNVDGKLEQKLSGHAAALRSVAWSRSGRIAAVDSSGVIYLRTAIDQEPRTLAKLGARVVAYSPDGSRLAVGLANSIQIWNADGTSTAQQETPGGLTYLSWSPDGKRIAWAGANAGVWEPGGAASVLHTSTPATAIDFNPDGSRFAAVHADGRLRWWRSDGSLEEMSSAGGLAAGGLTAGGVTSGGLATVAWSIDGATVAAAGGKDLFLWTTDRQPRATFDPAFNAIYGLAWGPTGQLAIVGNAEAPRIFDVSGAAGPEFRGHPKKLVMLVAWNPGANRIATATRDETIRLWSGDGVPGPVIEAPLASAIAWSPDGSLLASAFLASTNPRIKLFNADGSDGPEIKGTSDVRALAWSPDSQRLAAADRSGVVRILLRDGQTERELPGHTGELRSLAWSRAGQIVSSGEDGVLRCWDASGQLLWMAIASTSGQSSALSAAGKTLGDPAAAEKTLVYLVERSPGKIEVLAPSAFGEFSP